jgi:hypothetical protein
VTDQLVTVERLDQRGLEWAQRTVALRHYRHSPVLARACPEGWGVTVGELGRVGCLIVGRPQATLCRPWYGSVDDVAAERCDVTRWQVLNLARVWLDPSVQAGGQFCGPEWLPGFIDRRGVWHSTLASNALARLAAQVGGEYLLARPPVFVDEPYELRWLLSYCDTRTHRGVIYRDAGWELYRTNQDGMQTWRLPLRPLSAAQHVAIAEASRVCPRARRFRAERDRERAQLPLEAVA